MDAKLVELFREAGVDVSTPQAVKTLDWFYGFCQENEKQPEIFGHFGDWAAARDKFRDAHKTRGPELESARIAFKKSWEDLADAAVHLVMRLYEEQKEKLAHVSFELNAAKDALKAGGLEDVMSKVKQLEGELAAARVRIKELETAKASLANGNSGLQFQVENLTTKLAEAESKLVKAGGGKKAGWPPEAVVVAVILGFGLGLGVHMFLSNRAEDQKLVAARAEVDSLKAQANKLVADKEQAEKEKNDLAGALERISAGTGIVWAKSEQSPGQYGDKVVEVVRPLMLIPTVSMWDLTFVDMTNGKGRMLGVCPPDRPNLLVEQFESEMTAKFFEAECVLPVMQ